MSNSIGSERLSRVLGYLLTPGLFNENAGYLPRRVAVFCEANTANQGTIEFNTPIQIMSAKQAGELLGWGSPAHINARILFPVNGGGPIGGIPVYFVIQETPGGAAARVLTITPTGAATANGTHTVVINGRRGIDGESYDINIETGDDETDICNKIEDVLNNVLGCPVSANNTSPTDAVVCTTKWQGLTAQGVNIYIDTNGNDLGISYSVSQTAAGSGSPTVTTGLTSLGNEWFTGILNSYGTNNNICEEFETWNGRPDTSTPTGNFAGVKMRPSIVYTGSTSDNDTAFTDARKLDCTIAICPAPKSDAHQMEAAANYLAVYERIAQDEPHLDINGKFLPDMPMALDQFAMMDYDVRDQYIKKGCSTVDNVAGEYCVQDFVTTYHPVGENPPQHRYVRNLTVDFNVKFMYRVLEVKHVLDKVIANDDDDVAVSNYIKPKMWKATIVGFASTLGRLGLIADVAFMQKNIQVKISNVNPDRFESRFPYKRTGTARILDTVVQAGFNLGQL